MMRLNLYLIAAIALSLLIIASMMPQSVYAQSITKPSVPEFTLKYVDHSYDVPPTTITTIDPYKGKQTTTTQSGYHVENKTIDVFIENQPFTSNKETNGNYTSLFYNLRYKPHYTSEWWYYYEYNPYARFPTQHYVKADATKLNTIVSLPHREDINFSHDGQVDVQVYAVVTSETTIVLYGTTLYYYQNGTESNWSSIKTITIPTGSVSTSTPNPTSPTTPSYSPDPTSQNTESTEPPPNGTDVLFGLNWEQLAITGLVIAVVALSVALLVSRRRKGETIKNQSAICLLIILACSVVMMSGSATAQSIPKPSVPQFSIQVVDHSYDIPTTYSTDSYTGKQITHPGYHVDDIRIEGNIKNQKFTPYTIPNPNSKNNQEKINIEFYYDIRYKGHFGEEWRKLYGSKDVDFLKQEYGVEYSNFTASRYNALEFQDGAQMDFQVKAVIGFETWGYASSWPYRILNGEDSGWSNTLTVTVSKNSTITNTYASTIDSSPYPTLTSPETKTSTPAPSPTVPEFSALMLTPLFAVGLLAVIALKFKGQKVGAR